MCASRYYNRSSLLASLLALASFGCAESPTSIAARAPVVSFAALSADPTRGAPIAQLPVVIAFDQGARVPFEILLVTPYVVTEPNPARVQLVATRPFWVLLAADGRMFVSLDGKDFEHHGGPNSFRAGFAVTPEGAKIEARVDIPAKKAP